MTELTSACEMCSAPMKEECCYKSPYGLCRICFLQENKVREEDKDEAELTTIAKDGMLILIFIFYIHILYSYVDIYDVYVLQISGSNSTKSTQQ